MSLDIQIVQTAADKKTLPLKVVLGADFLYGAYDEGWRLHTGLKNDNNLVCYMPTQIARGIAVNWDEDEVDMIRIRALLPTAPVELRALYEMIYRIYDYWQCEIIIDDKPMDIEDFLDDFEGILAFNEHTLHNMAKSILNGENQELTLFAVKWPMVMGKNEAEAFVAEPSYFPKWLHDKQKIDAHHSMPSFYRGENGIIGRHALPQDTRCIMPIKPYVPYGFNDPETGELIQCEDYGVLLFNVLENETIAEIKYSDFIARVRRNFSSKVKGYDGNHIIIEGLSVDELKKLAE